MTPDPQQVVQVIFDPHVTIAVSVLMIAWVALVIIAVVDLAEAKRQR